MFYRGGDCNIAYTTAKPAYPLTDFLCAAETKNAKVLDELRFTNIQYNAMSGYSQYSPVILLGFYELNMRKLTGTE